MGLPRAEKVRLANTKMLAEECR